MKANARNRIGWLSLFVLIMGLLQACGDDDGAEPGQPPACDTCDQDTCLVNGVDTCQPDNQCIPYDTVLNTDSAALTLSFDGSWKGEDFYLLDKYPVNGLSDSIQISTLKFYVNNIRLVNANNEYTPVGGVHFVDFLNKHCRTCKTQHAAGGEDVTFNVPPGAWKGVAFDIGVTNYNTTDFREPQAYCPDHPLNDSKGMFWSWNTGYIFFKIEGSMDTLPGASDTVPEYQYTWFHHIGNPGNLMSFEYATPGSLLTTEGFITKMDLVLHLDEYFDPQAFGLITQNMRVDVQTHSGGSTAYVAEQGASNLEALIRFEGGITQEQY